MYFHIFFYSLCDKNTSNDRNWIASERVCFICYVDIPRLPASPRASHPAASTPGRARLSGKPGDWAESGPRYELIRIWLSIRVYNDLNLSEMRFISVCEPVSVKVGMLMLLASVFWR